MNRRQLATGLALGIAAASCGSPQPHAQWVVFVGTDAPVPQFGQQLLVELLDEKGDVQSAEATRFIDASNPADWPISFGVVPDSAQDRPRIRVRLYRMDETGSDGLPASTSLIDATATLPGANGITRVGLVLSMACFGVPSNPATKQTCNSNTRQLGDEPILSSAVAVNTLPTPGSWSEATPAPCRGPAPSGMTCVSGGPFLLGSQQYFPDAPETEPVPQHLVVLSPFAIDTAEVTVGEVRQLVQAGVVAAPIAQGASGAPDGRSEECTYLSADDATNDNQPANCLPWSSADLACQAVGKRLPTEAEWEYAARNLNLETPYPWGSAATVCQYAVVASGVGLFADATECETSGGTVSVGPLPGGNPLDATTLGVLNLAGNVSEWMADYFAPYSGPCWSGGDPLINPICQSPSAAHAVRGGSWQSAVYLASPAARTAPPSDAASEAIGFRCALSM